MYSVSPLQALRFTKDASRTFYNHLTADEGRVNMQIHLGGVFCWFFFFFSFTVTAKWSFGPVFEK